MLSMTVIRFNDLSRPEKPNFKGMKAASETDGRTTDAGGRGNEGECGECVAEVTRLEPPLSDPSPVFPFVTEVNHSYSVGTRRPCIIEKELIDRCRAILHVNGVEPSNHDQRMVAEIFLYHKLYKLLNNPERRATEHSFTEDGQLKLGDEVELKQWRDEWDYLFRIRVCDGGNCR
jgi:hypothetical protein